MSIEAQNRRGGMLAALFVRRPVLAFVINIMIVIAGIAAFMGVEVRELPNVDQPTLSISTSYSGASAQTIDNEVTPTIEGAVARVQGVQSIQSSSSFGRSRVTLGFADGTDLDAATSDVRDALSRIQRRLPTDADGQALTPLVVKADPNASPVLQLSVTSKTVPRDELTTLVDNTITQRLAAVPGVADVQVYGEEQQAFLVDVDQNKLAAHGLTVADISTALNSVSFDAPTGTLNAPNQNIIIRAIAPVSSPADFESIIVKDNVRLGDVASVVFASSHPTSGLRSNGRQGIGIGIVRAAGSNTIDISNGIKQAVAELQPTLPKGVDLSISSDDSVFISSAVSEVEKALLLSVVIVVAVIYLFLLDWRATLVPALSMPVALIGTIAGIYLAGFSINILTLLAIVLATGLVVDDSIVVLENISRQRSLGYGPRAAAVVGAQEVFFAVMATTATLIAVFVPLSFLPGQTGQLFREFGFTLAISVLLSCMVALSLGPMLASRMLRPHDAHERGRFAPLRALGRATANLYRVCLHWCLRTPMAVILVAVLFAGAAWGVFQSLHQELTPTEDRSSIMLRVSAPSTVSLDYLQSQMQRIEDLLQPLRDSGELRSVFSISGFGSNTSSGFMVLTLAPWEERQRSQQQIVGDVYRALAEVPGVRAFVLQPNSLGIRGGGQGLQFAVLGNDYDKLFATAEKIKDAMGKDPRFGQVTVNYDPTQPEMTLTVDREKAAQLGININGLQATLDAMIDSYQVNTVFANDTTYPVNLVSTTNPVNDPHDLENIFIKTGDGRYVPISAIASLSEAPIAPSLSRDDQRRSISIRATLSNGATLGDAYQAVLTMAKPMLQPSQTIIPLAEAATLGQNNAGVAITFGFALVIILLVLSAQFESIWSAIIVMATVPFGLACAAFALKFTGQTLNVYSQIGLILVVGIMAKNGILIVEFANQLRDRGLGVHEAIEEAANIRLRPVVMTMIATVLGGLPLVLSHGAGAEARQALGYVMVVGLGLAAVSTLFLTPIAYLLLARFSRPRAEEAARLERELAGKAGPAPSVPPARPRGEDGGYEPGMEPEPAE